MIIGCLLFEGVLIDIWYCDKDGNYLEYGGIFMQLVDYMLNYFFCGRQVMDVLGIVLFSFIFLGWYQSCVMYIYVYIYNVFGIFLLVIQIVFLEFFNSVVVQVNLVILYGYIKGMIGYMYNVQDNVFLDDIVGVQVVIIIGDVNLGFVFDYMIKVNGFVFGLLEENFILFEVFFNLVLDEVMIIFSLFVVLKVILYLLDMNGRYIMILFED